MMAKVSLRIYNREIESLIEQNQLDEAIAHCHHILKTFPKHLETYRLLGKVFLEGKRYNEAVDIFSRILVSVPDDFVSHVGMSIINDDQNKLDNAIWHMERAFESQPSNAAIQGELQRLYGRRDGVIPPKIRMTRGALAHMYVQGELYSQAIAEIRAVLQQDPQRADIQVLLALAYFRGGQRADASDICAQLLKRYPYCFDANRILVELLPGSDRAESTQVYRMRIYELDPYATFTKDSVFKSGDVADAAVNLERLEYSGQDVLPKEDWGASLGAGLAPAISSDQQPDWLRAGMSDAGMDAHSFDQTPAEPASAPPTNEIPDFLRAAGWSESSGPSESGPSAFDSSGAAEEISPAEIPDWMKAMAPPQPSPQGATPIQPAATSSDDSADWLASLSGAGAASAAQFAEDSPFGTPVGGGQDVPDWLKGLGGEAPTPQPSSLGEPVLSQADVPDWLSGQGDKPQAASQPSSMDETSAWLKNLGDNQPEVAQPASSSDMPDWLGSFGGNEPSAAAQPAAPSDLPDWLGKLDAGQTDKAQQDIFTPSPIKPAPVASLDTLGASAKEQDDAVSWLESLASKHGAKPEELVTDPNSRSDIPPEWVDQARDIAQAQPPAPAVPQRPAASLDTLGASAKEQDDAVSWLESLASKHGAKPEELVTDPHSRSDIPPEWVDQARDIAQSQPPVPAVPQKPAASLDTLGASTKEQDDAVSWLESLASKHGAKSEELVTDPNSRSDVPPEWVEQARDIAQSQPAPQDELSAWLREQDKSEAQDLFAPKQGEQKPVTAGGAEDKETADWLASLAASPTPQSSDWGSLPLDTSKSLWDEPAPTPSAPAESTFEQPEEPIFKETSLKGAPTSAGLPDWLRGLDNETQKPATPVAGKIPSWLAAEEETLNSEFQPEPKPDLEPEPILPSDWHPVEPPPRKTELPPAQPQEPIRTPTRPAPAPVQPKVAKSTPKPAATRSAAAAPRSMDAILSQAQNELSRGDIPSAMEHYTRLIKKGRFLDDAIRDLREALYRYPIEVSIWQALGDAYMRSNRLQEALDAYTKAEELLR
jgi:tetratricopeptide (TPR) repeat protein